MSDWAKMAEDEANALVKIAEGEGRKVMVVIMASDAAQGVGSLIHAVSDGCTGADARAFVQCLDRQRDRVASKLIRKSS